MPSIKSERGQGGTFMGVSPYRKRISGNRLDREYAYREKGKHITRKSYLSTAYDSMQQYVSDLKEMTQNKSLPVQSDILMSKGLFAVIEPRSGISCSEKMVSPIYDSKTGEYKIERRKTTDGNDPFSPVLSSIYEEDKKEKSTDPDERLRTKGGRDLIRTVKKSSDEYVKMLAKKGITKECPEERDGYGVFVVTHVFILEGERDGTGLKEDKIEEKKVKNKLVGTMRTFVKINPLDSYSEEFCNKKGKQIEDILLDRAERLISTSTVANEIQKNSVLGKVVLRHNIDLVPMRSDYMKNVVGVVPFEKSADYCSESFGLIRANHKVEEYKYNSMINSEMTLGKTSIMTEEERRGTDIGDGIIVY